MTPVAGLRYSYKGVSLDVHKVHHGFVYFRKWEPRKRTMPFLDGLGRIEVSKWKVLMAEYGHVVTVTEHHESITVKRRVAS